MGKVELRENQSTFFVDFFLVGRLSEKIKSLWNCTINVKQPIYSVKEAIKLLPKHIEILGSF